MTYSLLHVWTLNLPQLKYVTGICLSLYHGNYILSVLYVKVTFSKMRGKQWECVLLRRHLGSSFSTFYAPFVDLSTAGAASHTDTLGARIQKLLTLDELPLS